MKKLIILVSLIVSVFASGILKTQDVYDLTGVEAVEKYKKDIVASARKTGVWASVTAAQLLVESGSGELSELASKDNNLFGIKWSKYHADRYPGAKPVSYQTNEDYGNGTVSITDEFTSSPK